MGVVLVAARHQLGQWLLTRGVSALTGVDVHSDDAEVDLTRLTIAVTGLRVMNPPRFPVQVMADIPELYLDAEWTLSLRNDIAVRMLRVYLKQLTVVKAQDGTLNLQAIPALAHQPAAGSDASAGVPAPRVHVDQLDLRIDEVVYVDATHTPPRQHRFPVDLHEHYAHFTHPEALVRLVVRRALVKTAVHRLAGFELPLVEQGLDETVDTAEATAGQAVQTLEHVLKP